MASGVLRLNGSRAMGFTCFLKSKSICGDNSGEVYNDEAPYTLHLMYFIRLSMIYGEQL